MNIRWKLTILLSTAFALFVAMAQIIHRQVVTPTFIKLEQDEAVKDMERCTDAMHREVNQLSIFLRTWSAWDDCYQFAVDHNDAFIKSNCPPETYTNNNLNLIWITDLTGKIIWGETRDDRDGKLMDLGTFSPSVLNAHNSLVAFSSPMDMTGGIVMTSSGPMYIVSRPIVTSHNEGPIHGAIIMGRLIRWEEIKQLVDQTHVQFAMWSVTDPALPLAAQQATADLNPGAQAVRDGGNGFLYVYSNMADIYGKPCLIIRAEIPKAISAHGDTAGNVALYSNIVGGAVIMLFLGFVLRQTVSRPLLRLSSHMARVGQSDNLKSQLNMNRRDEIGQLAAAFDKMVAALFESRAKVLKTARQAGMAEIATGVLHNVGNVLNSVNTSAVVLRENLQNTKSANLGKAAAMIQEHRPDLGEFLSTDPKGKGIPDYLSRVAASIADEQALACQELDHLCRSVDHIKQIVAAQQSFAKPDRLLEEISLAELVEEALRLNADSLTRHQITVERLFEEFPNVIIDQHKVLQILVNLIANAKHAIVENRTSEKRITISIASARCEGTLMSKINVTDTGVGIAPQAMARLFQHGFTTRKSGHGFGLHAAANDAREMGGSLTATSGGVGTGATFVLELPLKPAEVRQS